MFARGRRICHVRDGHRIDRKPRVHPRPASCAPPQCSASPWEMTMTARGAVSGSKPGRRGLCRTSGNSISRFSSCSGRSTPPSHFVLIQGLRCTALVANGSHSYIVGFVTGQTKLPMSRFTRPASLLVTALGLATLVSAQAQAAPPEFTLVIKEHKFTPTELEVPAGQKIRLIVENQDPTPESSRAAAQPRRSWPALRVSWCTSGRSIWQVRVLAISIRPLLAAG
jgi:hypothetical protein